MLDMLQALAESLFDRKLANMGYAIYIKPKVTLRDDLESRCAVSDQNIILLVEHHINLLEMHEAIIVCS